MFLGDESKTVPETSLANNAVFHKSCRDLFREKEKIRMMKRHCKRENVTDECSSTPSKKTRSSFDSCVSKNKPQCVVCLGETNTSGNPLRKLGKDNVAIKNWAHKAMNWPVYTRLIAAFDNTACNIYYHHDWRTAIHNEARTKKL